MCLPNFLIIGTAKAGTSTVHEWCKAHPQVFVPMMKEPHFFEMEGRDKSKLHPSDHEVIVDIEEYRNLFKPGKDYPARGEATVFYLLSEKAAQGIKHYIPDCKLFVFVRDPAERAYSHFLYSQQIGRAPKEWTFQEAWNTKHEVWDFKYKEMGQYKTYISMYDKYFSPDQIHILFFDDLVENTEAFAKQFFRILGVDDSFKPDLSVKYAKSGKPKSRFLHRFLLERNIFKDLFKWIIPFQKRIYLREFLFERNLVKPPLDPEIRRDLVDFYREDILWLQERTGRDCSGWLGT